ncbi:Zinc finger C2H2-type [Sesbania bispinosa]|nr:Zinc finger C2H2-type [Sesbania bispinosa]
MANPNVLPATLDYRKGTCIPPADCHTTNNPLPSTNTLSYLSRYNQIINEKAQPVQLIPLSPTNRARPQEKNKSKESVMQQLQHLLLSPPPHLNHVGEGDGTSNPTGQSATDMLGRLTDAQPRGPKPQTVLPNYSYSTISSWASGEDLPGEGCPPSEILNGFRGIRTHVHEETKGQEGPTITNIPSASTLRNMKNEIGRKGKNHQRGSGEKKDGNYDGRIHSIRYEKNGPYTCSECYQQFPTSQKFAAHVNGSHYKHETKTQKRKRLLARNQRRNHLRLQKVNGEITFVPVSNSELKVGEERAATVMRVKVEAGDDGDHQVALPATKETLGKGIKLERADDA